MFVNTPLDGCGVNQLQYLPLLQSELPLLFAADERPVAPEHLISLLQLMSKGCWEITDPVLNHSLKNKRQTSIKLKPASLKRPRRTKHIRKVCKALELGQMCFLICACKTMLKCIMSFRTLCWKQAGSAILFISDVFNESWRIFSSISLIYYKVYLYLSLL